MGVDGKIFARLRLEGRPLQHLDWLEPERREPIQTYAGRMAAQITDQGPVDLIGLSFGGIMAVEMAHLIPVRNIFLISSIKSRQEKPFFFKVMRYLPFYLTNVRFLRDRTTWFWGRYFGLQSKEDIELFYRFMPGLSDRYMRWAVQQMCKWKNEEVPARVVHIHGDKDRIFPVHSCEPHHVIPGANHSMVFTHGHEVSRIIADRLSDFSDPGSVLSPRGKRSGFTATVDDGSLPQY
jgi:pimeloyl-ACP methyl ester carboxylesterase